MIAAEKDRTIKLAIAQQEANLVFQFVLTGSAKYKPIRPKLVPVTIILALKVMPFCVASPQK